ncbi:MAG TPA: SDR family NAD(P)-dependent oxidoreductase [Chitinophagaceae bacterium]|nr:SDR family NAD(P)-dependent oxidoreductase [Chitinophagaceae bacterium]
MKLSGNTVLITGATSGIGLGLAKAFLEAGSQVIICGRRAERLAQAGSLYAGLIPYEADLQDPAQRESLCQKVLRDHPGLNVLVNNAGIQLTSDLTRPVGLDRIRAEVEINLVAPIHLTSLLSQALSSKQEAAVINISSGLAFVPLAFMPVYCATKAAMHSLTLSLRHQLRKTPVQVFEIIPPSVDTELGHERRPDKNSSHGGMPVETFTTEVMEALRRDQLEAAIGDARNLREQGENWFARLNR